jgi:hypothetical protein
MMLCFVMPGTRVRLRRPEHKPCAGHPRLADQSVLKTWMAGTTLAVVLDDRSPGHDA